MSDFTLGCDITRLREFVSEYYTVRTVRSNAIDDPFFAFVWSVIVQQPVIRVGTVPEGLSSDVFIPAQPRGSKRSKNDPENENEVVTLMPVPASEKSDLSALNRIHGARLRISVDPETCFVAITGSHTKVMFRSQMIWTSH